MLNDPLSPLTDAEIAALERLEKAATPGPWWYSALEDEEGVSSENGAILHELSQELGQPGAVPVYEGGVAGADMLETDIRFCATARTLLPRLLAEVKRLRQDLAVHRAADRGEKLLVRDYEDGFRAGIEAAAKACETETRTSDHNAACAKTIGKEGAHAE